MELEKLLTAVKNGKLSVKEAEDRLKTLPYDDLGFARVDHHRALRRGFSEAIFCQGKTPEQAARIAKSLADAGQNVLATRAEKSHYDAVRALLPDAEYHPEARIVLCMKEKPRALGAIAVCTGGTADIPVAEEAALTAEAFGCEVTRLYDVGIAGIHRLLDQVNVLRRMRAVVAVAGMEGALAGVVGGLVDCPVIAVPTSIGYGANFGGLSALLTMLNTCAAGVGVVNIDNGFGAGYLAAQIARVAQDAKKEASS